MNRRELLRGSIASALVLARLARASAVIQGGSRLFSAPATTADFYISPTGNDSNDGLTTSTPWTINALADATKMSALAASTNKTLGFMDGTYRVTGSNQEACISLHANAAGTSGAHTKFVALNNRAAIVTTNNGAGVYPQGATSPAAIQTEAAYLEFRGIKFTDMAHAGLSIHSSHIYIYDCEFSNIVTTRNTSFNDSNCGGVYFRDSSLAKTDVLIHNCLFSDITNYSQGGSTLRDSKSEGVGSLFGITALIIENCTFKNLGQPTYNKVNVANVTFRYNYVYNCYVGYLAAPGVEGSLRNGSSLNEVYGNIFVVNNMFGAASAWIANVASDTFRFYNNTCVLKTIDGTDDGNNFGYFDFADEASSTTVYNQAAYFYNNIITAPSGLTGTPATLIRFRSGTQSPQNRMTVMDYNSYYPSTDFQVWDEANAHSYTTLAAWQAAYGSLNKDLNSAVQDPLLVNASGTTLAEFALQSGSPCKSTGATPGKVGGVSGGSSVDMGYSGVISTPGCDF
jgi:hypothetical protein